jgi:hypothetical protein
MSPVTFRSLALLVSGEIGGQVSLQDIETSIRGLHALVIEDRDPDCELVNAFNNLDPEGP